MTWGVALFLVMLMTFGAFWEGIADSSTDSLSAEETAAFNSAFGNARVLGIDDASLDAGPLNTGFGFGAAVNPQTWTTLFGLLDFDYSFLVGDLVIVQWFLQAISVALILLLSYLVAQTLLTAVRTFGGLLGG